MTDREMIIYLLEKGGTSYDIEQSCGYYITVPGVITYHLRSDDSLDWIAHGYMECE